MAQPHEQTPDQRIFQSIPWLRYTDELRPYDGAPVSAGDSIFLGEGLPLLDTMMTFFQSYNPKGKRDEQRGKANWLVHQMIMNPELFPLPQVFDSCLALEETFPDHIRALRTDLPKAFTEQSRATVDQAIAERQLPLLKIAVRNPAYSEQAKDVLRLWYGASNTQERVVRTMYHTLLAALRSNDPDVERFAAEITTFYTSILPETSRQATLYVASQYSESDDLLAVHMVVDETISFLRRTHLPHTNTPDQSIYTRLPINDTIVSAYLRSQQFNSQRLQAITDYYRYQEQLTLAAPGNVATTAQRVDAATGYPYTLSRKQSELRQLLSARLMEHIARQDAELRTMTITLPDNTLLPFSTKEDVRLTAMQLLEYFLREGHGVIADLNAVHDILEFLGPPYLHHNAEKVNKLHEIRTQLKQDIWKNAVYTVSPRGDRIPVDTPELTDLGLKELVFHLGRHGMETRVTIILQDYALPLILDRHYNLMGRNGEELRLSRDARNWWESIIMSHLHPLVTGSRDGWVDDHGHRSGSRTRVHGEQKMTESRRGFRRKLPPGQCFTPEQAALVEAELFINLATYNADRGLNREAGQYTWVLPMYMPSVSSALTNEPMTVYIPRAAASLFTALNLE